MKKFIYGALVVIFAAGGIISLANLLGNNVTPAAPTPPGEAQVLSAFEPSPFGDFAHASDSVVSIVQATEVERAEDLTFEDVAVMVRDAVAMAGGLESIVSDGDVVILKPNLVTMRCNTLPGWQGRRLPAEVNGNSTDYRVTRAVAQIVRELNPSGRIYVIEGSIQDTNEVFVAMNYTHEHIPEVDDFFALEDISGDWREFDSPYLVRIVPENPLFRDAYYVNRMFYEADVIINLPTLKNHWETVTTGAVKNIGIGMTPSNIYSNARGDNHRFGVPHGVHALHQFIADYYMIRPSDFVVMDALQGLSHGPTPSYSMSGIRNIRDAQQNLRSILASSDGLAIDVVQTNIMNWDIDTVTHLQYLMAADFGNGDSQNIVVLGARVDDLRTDFDGVIPITGGRRLRAAAPPTVSIEEAGYYNGYLQLQLDVSATTDKVDIYIDGFYLTSATGNFGNISIDMRGQFGNSRDVAVYAFDNRMRHGRESVMVGAAEDVSVDDPPADDPADETVHNYIYLRIDYLFGHYPGGDVTLEAAPFIADGRTMVPFRFIGEALGAEVDWDAEWLTATFIRDGETFYLQIGEGLQDADGEYMGTPVIVEGRTFVPVRFVSEMMGAEVIWDPEARSVTIPLG